MAFPSLVVLIFVFLLSGIVIMRPFLEDMEGEIAAGDESGEVDALVAEKERLLSAIEELDRDQQLSRISDNDYSISRESLVRQAAQIFQLLDQMKIALEETPIKSEVDDQELAGYIESSWNEIDLEGIRICGSCGSQVAENDLFCRQCGEKLPN
jgi:hypothetical protein